VAEDDGEDVQHRDRERNGRQRRSRHHESVGVGIEIHEPQIEDIEDSRKGSIIARADAAGYPSIEASLEFGRCAGSAESRPCAAPPTRIASPP
jgi:hypothetical protein